MTTQRCKYNLIVALILLGGAGGACSSLYAEHIPESGSHGRKVLNFNQGWRFVRLESTSAHPEKRATASAGNASTLDASALGFDDRSWEVVNTPHAVRLETWNASGGKNFQGLCWYRKHFTPEPGWSGKKQFLTFEGAMQIAEVWINGAKVTTHYGGYLPFVLDVTKLLKLGADNVVAIRLDNRNQPLVPPGQPQEDLDFTYCGGLYRNVSFTVTDRLHITDPIFANKPGGGGVLVSYPDLSAESVTVQVRTEIKNEGTTSRNCQLRQSIVDAAEREVGAVLMPVTIDSGSEKTLIQEIKVPRPQLWHPHHPTLYTLRTQILNGAVTVDELSTRIGLRRFEFKEKSLFINGEKFYSFGANHHQQYVYIGNAVPDSLQRQDVKLMREAGMTSFRSHYPHAASFMDACDELGLLAIVSTPGWHHFSNDPLFLQRAYQNTREMIRWNRNRPSVILWELGLNESDYTKTFIQESQRIAHEEMPVAPCYTSGDAYSPWQKDDPIFDVIYSSSAANRFVDRVQRTRETGDCWGGMNWDDQVSDNRISRAMGEHAMLLQAGAHLNNARCRDHAGADLWAGIDCDRGYHPVPFLGGFLDQARLPKFDFYMFASQRPADVRVPGLDDGPMVFIANLLTHYSPQDVTVFSNCEEVRLLRTADVRSAEARPEVEIGRRKVKVNENGSREPVIFTAAISEFEGARLRAQGLMGAQVVAEYSISASGAPRKLILSAQGGHRNLVADGSDILPISARIADKYGNTVTFDDRSIMLSVTGPATVVGDASIEANPCRSVLGVASFLVQSTPLAGTITIHAQAQGLSPYELVIHSIPLRSSVVRGRDVGIVTAKKSSDSADLGSSAVQADWKVLEEQKHSDSVRNTK